MNRTNAVITDKMIQTNINRILLVGTLLAMVFVITGAMVYLYQNANEPLQMLWFQPSTHTVSVLAIWQFVGKGTPLSWIELGLLLLVATQTLRVVLLAVFYTLTRDTVFAWISYFIAAVLLYSTFRT